MRVTERKTIGDKKVITFKSMRNVLEKLAYLEDMEESGSLLIYERTPNKTEKKEKK